MSVEESRYSPKFNSPSADITFKSSDGVFFRIHRKNLEVCTEGFPPSDVVATEDEVVELTETSTTLELLFQFIYPQRHPALDTTPFDILYPLAEASEKYQVFPAMNICHIRLRDMVQQHPAEISVYAAKHNYPYLVSHVAPMMIGMDPIKVAQILPPHLIVPWTRYIQEWIRVHRQTTLVLTYNGRCHEDRKICDSRITNENAWQIFAFSCMRKLSSGIQTLRALDEVFDVAQDWKVMKDTFVRYELRANAPVPQCCQNDLAAWRKKIDDAIASIPKFSTFL
ncbi:hypothetical protein R3P38DRAFT_2906626 [Favolaschia claudopus]|uniref:BTB domain-containing protein n=1 Tax=Favolaschia claudopus TaxID=2862362 RepID=A0AAW0CKT1_9AGAR